MVAAAAPESHGRILPDSAMNRVGLANRWVRVWACGAACVGASVLMAEM